MAGESTDSLHDALEVLRRKVCRSQVLNHVVEDEECELEALLLVAAEAVRDDLVAQTLHETLNRLLVRLEEGTHELSCGDL